MDLRAKIVEELDVLQKKEHQERNVFKARAYGKVVANLKALDRPVRQLADLDGVEGIGDRIRAKIQEILATGQLRAAEDIKNDSALNMAEVLTGVYGIGPVKAKNLLAEHRVKSMEEFREVVAKNPKLLNDKQHIGLKHYEDLLLRIPRKEMEGHDRKIQGCLPKGMMATLVGSFRRGAEDSGDIDVLVGYRDIPHTDAIANFKKIIDSLKGEGYITDVLASGEKKFMGVCQLDSTKPARRLDMLLTPPSEYPYALLYFTGSDKYNIRVRKHALENGYTLNEHGMKGIREGMEEPPVMASERDIVSFLGLPYVAPEQRM